MSAVSSPTDPSDEQGSSPDPTASAYDADGVDRSLVRWMLALSPSERLEYAQGVIDLVGSVARTDGNR